MALPRRASLALPPEIEDFFALAMACGSRSVDILLDQPELIAKFHSRDETAVSEWKGQTRERVVAALRRDIPPHIGLDGVPLTLDGREMPVSVMGSLDSAGRLLRMRLIAFHQPLGAHFARLAFCASWLRARHDAREIEAAAATPVDWERPQGTLRAGDGLPDAARRL